MYTTLFLSILLSFSTGQSQDPDGYVSAIQSYYEALETDPTYVSELQGLATADPDAIESLELLITATDFQDLTAELTELSILPTPYNVEIPSLLSSVFNAEYSIASKYGVLSDGQLGGGGGAPTLFTPSATGAGFPTMTSGLDGNPTSAPIFSFDTSATHASAQSNASLSTTESTTSSSSNTLLSVTTPTTTTSITPTGASTTTIGSKAQAASTALPFVAGMAAFIAGGLAIGL